MPLLNVKQYNDLGGKEGILDVLKDAEAKLLITDSALNISDKLAAAGEAGAEVIFTQTSGFDYEHIFDNTEALTGFLEERGLIGGGYVKAAEDAAGDNDDNNSDSDEGVKE